jgi:uncharacterized membrane protein YfcA
LAAKLPAAPLAVLAGTTAGMLTADSIGIVAGVILRRKIPERKIKLVSASAFMLFGLIGSYRVFRNDLGLPLPAAAGILLALAAIASLAAFLLLRAEKKRDRPSPDDPMQY